MAAEYKTKSPAFINDTMVPAGTTINFEGEPGDNLEPLNDEAHAAFATAAARRAEKAQAIKSAIAGTIDPATADSVAALIDQVRDFAVRLAAAEARVATVEAKSAPDLSAYATKADVDAVKADAAELDQGLTLVSSRVSEVEGVLGSLAAQPAPAPAPAPAPEQPAPPAE
jgi:hypothetical protein